MEFKVEEDLVAGTVPSERSERLEPLGAWEVALLVFRRRKSLKKGILCFGLSNG